MGAGGRERARGAHRKHILVLNIHGSAFFASECGAGPPPLALFSAAFTLRPPRARRSEVGGSDGADFGCVGARAEGRAATAAQLAIAAFFGGGRGGREQSGSVKLWHRTNCCTRRFFAKVMRTSGVKIRKDSREKNLCWRTVVIRPFHGIEYMISCTGRHRAFPLYVSEFLQ